MKFTILNAGLQAKGEAPASHVKECISHFPSNVYIISETGTLPPLLKELQPLKTSISKVMAYSGDRVLVGWDAERFEMKELPRALVNVWNDVAKAHPVLLYDLKLKTQMMVAGVHLSRRDKKAQEYQLEQIRSLEEGVEGNVDFDSLIFAGDFNTRDDHLEEYVGDKHEVNIHRVTTRAGHRIDNLLTSRGGVLEKKGNEKIMKGSLYTHHPIQVSLCMKEGEEEKD